MREFAVLLGVSERTIAKWEEGQATTEPRLVMQAALDTACARSTDDERRRFVAMIGPTAPNLDEAVPAEFVLRLRAGAAIEVAADPLAVVIQSGAYRLSVVPVAARWDGLLTVDDVAVVRRLADAMLALSKRLHERALAQRRRTYRSRS